jgi:hypothetical protein
MITEYINWKWLLKLLAWLSSRPVLSVRITEDKADEEVGGLKFEVENIRNKTTSLSPTVNAHFLSIKGEREAATFDVREQNRTLPPFVPKVFFASARRAQPKRQYALFRVYVFSPTKGRTHRAYVRDASLEQIGFFRFWIEKLWFLRTGQVLGIKTSITMDEYRAQKRSRGPH